MKCNLCNGHGCTYCNPGKFGKKAMAQGLKTHKNYEKYLAGIADIIYNGRDQHRRLSKDGCFEVSKEIIKRIWGIASKRRGGHNNHPNSQRKQI